MDEETGNDLSAEELRDEKGDLLPAREVMSLITTSPSAPVMPGTEPLDNVAGATGTAQDAPGATDDASALTGTDAAGSASESDAEPVAEDRSETFTNRDSAVSET